MVLCLAALLVALTAWAVISTGGGKRGNGANANGAHAPATAITPGPSPSGTFVSGRPGGPVGGSGDGSSGGGTGGDTPGAGGATGSAVDGGTSGDGTGGGATPAQLPAVSTLPYCGSATVGITLRSVRKSYETYDKPRFSLTAANGGPTACKLDFGPASAVFTIDDADDRHVWGSDDCPADRSGHPVQVPANGTTTYTVAWDRGSSSPQCATPKGQPVPNGARYFVQAKLPGFAARRTSFVLKSG